MDSRTPCDSSLTKGLDLWLVNDDPSQLMVQKRLLGKLADSVRGFLSPIEALAAARFGESPRFLITDFHMPGMDGPELARLWCDLHSDARVLVVSASEVSRNERDKIEALPSDCVKLLTSYRITDLQDQANTWFREEASLEMGSAPASTEARLDPTVLEKLGSLGGPAFVTKTVNRFLRTGPEKVEALSSAFTAGDYVRMHELAHSLKGSCGIVGALSLSAALDKVETATAPEGSHEDLETSLREVQAECRATVEELENLYP